jgi:hypothetical protein
MGVASGVEGAWQDNSKTKRVTKRSRRFISSPLYQVECGKSREKRPTIAFELAAALG